MRIVLLFLSTILFAVDHTFAQNQHNVAVMRFEGDNAIDNSQLDFLSAKFTSELLKTNSFIVLERSKMDFILREQGFQQSGICNSSECKVQMGQILGVDYIISGKLAKFGKIYALHLDYINIESGEIIQTVDIEQTGELEDVYKRIPKSAALKLQRLLFKNTISADKGTSPIVDYQPTAEPIVPTDAIPKAKSTQLSNKRKIAIALWGAGVGVSLLGYYYNSSGEEYMQSYNDALANENQEAAQVAYNDTHKAEDKRNISYSLSISSLVIGTVLWFWPEGK